MVKIGMLLPEERMVEPERKIIEENRDKEYRFQLEEPFNKKDLKEKYKLDIIGVRNINEAMKKIGIK